MLAIISSTPASMHAKGKCYVVYISALIDPLCSPSLAYPQSFHHFKLLIKLAKLHIFFSMGVGREGSILHTVHILERLFRPNLINIDGGGSAFNDGSIMTCALEVT